MAARQFKRRMLKRRLLRKEKFEDKCIRFDDKEFTMPLGFTILRLYGKFFDSGQLSRPLAMEPDIRN
jgi:hypothetical protein